MRRLLASLAALCLLTVDHHGSRNGILVDAKPDLTPIENNNSPLINTECNLCDRTPPISKCTDCEAPIKSKNQMTARCSGTLSCAPGRLLIANNRYVVTDVRCSEYSSKSEEVWIGKTSIGHSILVENAACFITPISCFALGSFSSRCPRGFACKSVHADRVDSRLSCNQGFFENWLNLNLRRKSMWYRDRKDEWQELVAGLVCDPKLGSWIEEVAKNKTKGPVAVVSDRIICGKREFVIYGLGLTIEFKLMELVVKATVICVPIILIAGVCIFFLLRQRAYLLEMKKYLDDRHDVGMQRMMDLKASSKHKVELLIGRWQEVNKHVVNENKGTVQAFLKNKKKKH